MLERIEQVLDEQVRPYLQGHGGAVEVRELTEDGLLEQALHVKFSDIEQDDEDLLAQARAILRRRASPDGGK